MLRRHSKVIKIEVIVFMNSILLAIADICECRHSQNFGVVRKGCTMAIVRKSKLREMNNNELTEKLRELRLEISKEIAASEVGGTVKNSGRIRESKKTIARILTEVHGREKRQSVAHHKKTAGGTGKTPKK